MHHVKRALELFRRDRDAVDLNPFRGLNQMRRGEQPGADAGGSNARLDHGAGRAFAVGPRHVNHAVCSLRIAQRGENRADAVQPKLGRLNLVTKCVEESD